MAYGKLFNLLAVSSLVILACSFGSTPVNALSINTNHDVFIRANPHANLAKKKRSDLKKRCKPRSTPAPAATTHTPDKPATTPSSTPSPSPKSASSTTTYNSGGRKVGLGWVGNNNDDLPHFVTNNVGP